MKKFSIEQMKSFVHGLPHAMGLEKLVFAVTVHGHKKNKYSVCMSDSTGVLWHVNYCHDDISETLSMPRLDTMLEEKHPGMMLRPQYILMADFIEKYGIDESKVVECMFEAMRSKFNSRLKLAKKFGSGFSEAGTAAFYAHSLCGAYAIKHSPRFHSFDKFIVWADLNCISR